jgi:hypothetical protein
MMKIDDPVDLANAARTELQAARALAALEAEISLGDRPESWYHQADEALARLHARWPRAHQRDAYREPPSLSPQARRRDREPPGRHERRRRRHWRELAVVAAIAVAIGLAVRRMRRHPKLVLAAAVVLSSAVALHQPAVVGLSLVAALLARMQRGRPGKARGIRAPKAPRARHAVPRAPTAPRIAGCSGGAPRPPRFR